MKLPLSWIKDFVDITLSPEEIAYKLTFGGLEVEHGGSGTRELMSQAVIHEIAHVGGIGARVMAVQEKELPWVVWTF